jgi:hypothetical protein
MDNSPAHSLYIELSLSQQSYHAIPEPTIHHPEQEDTSEDEDEERESSIEGDTNKNMLQLLNLLLLLRHFLQKPFYPKAERTEPEVAQG